MRNVNAPANTPGGRSPSGTSNVSLKLPATPERLKEMGRFASTVEFYARYREPYPPAFFKKVAEEIGLCGNESLLDVGCGPGLLAIGFSPFVGRCTGLDPEPGMIEAAKAAAAEAGITLSLIQGRIEELPTTETYDVITVGRALHWLERTASLVVLERILARDSSRILVCRASSTERPETAWAKPYEEVRRAWASGPSEKRYRIDAKEWFRGSRFTELGETSVTECRRITISDLVRRALSKSNTSPEILGAGQAKFEAEISAALEPYVRDGVLVEHIVAKASIFGRIR